MSDKIINLIKIVSIVVIVLAFIFPILPVGIKTKKIKNLSGLRYKAPKHKRNFPFVFLFILEFVVITLLYSALKSLADTILNIDFVQKLLQKVKGFVGTTPEYYIIVILALVVNLIVLYGSIILKALFKKLVLNPIYKAILNRKKDKASDEKNLKKARRIRKRRERLEKRKAKSSKKTQNEPVAEPITNGTKEALPFSHSTKEDETKDANPHGDCAAENIIKMNDINSTINQPLMSRVADFKHSTKADENKNEKTFVEKQKEVTELDVTTENVGKILKKPFEKFWGIFFEPDDYIYAKKWVIRTRKILQVFVWLVEATYIILFTLLLVSLFYPLNNNFYKFFIDIMRIKYWYLYPFISLIIIQEFVNTLNGPTKVEAKTEEELTEEEKIKRNEANLADLNVQLIKRFDGNHTLRFFPEPSPIHVDEYVSVHKEYASSIDFIKEYMKKISGRNVQSYVKIIDNIFGNNNIYFGGSFYSEFGEYLIAYTYTRLLTGARMIYVVSDKAKKDALREYISERITKFSGLYGKSVWRVRTTSERIDQADVLIASPDDFADDSMVRNNAVFFEEVCNAVFIDCDRMVELQNYLCPIMSMRLKQTSSKEISFIFISNLFYRGLSTSNLPKLFNLDKILVFSSAKENESVAYVLWNKESKNNRIYSVDGQKLSGIGCIVANMAYEHGIDGVKIISEDQIDHGSENFLTSHGVEINKFHKDIPDINYMIYEDDGYNLAASLYACTRFRGKYKSIVNIISKPYLLREYFMYKVGVNDYINRSAFVQPHITECLDDNKFSLLKLYLSCTNESMILIDEFERKCKDAFARNLFATDNEFCKKMLENKKPEHMNYFDFAEYLIAGLCDEPNTPEEKSEGHKAKNYYIVSTPMHKDRYTFSNEKDKYISFRETKIVFNRVLQSDHKVKLFLNDHVIGYLDTFPNRVPLEYTEGQSFHYNNIEYEIDTISDDFSSVFLRHENVVFQNTYDIYFLRRYKNLVINEKGPDLDVLVNASGNLSKIVVNRCNASFVGETYGYYTIMSNHQFLNLASNAEGNPLLEEKTIAKFKRDINKKNHVIKLTMKSRILVNDGMRLLLAAVFNEFLKTIFPHAYRCISIAPVLENPMKSYKDCEMQKEFVDRVRFLYPYLDGCEEKALEDELTFFFINDCQDDVGVLNWFDDKFGHYMEEFIADAYSYLHWLKVNDNLKHYIYFGSSSLPECYDLDGLCELLSGYNYIISEEGRKEFQTAGNDRVTDIMDCCSFCHRILESGRYQRFDENRFIDNECALSSVFQLKALKEINKDIASYLSVTYPENKFVIPQVKFFDPLHLDKNHLLSENLYYVVCDENTAYVERDDPLITVRVSLLRSQIELWQNSNNLVNQYSLGQLYYEELIFLRKHGEFDQSDWVYETIDPAVRKIVDEISNFTGISVYGEYNPNEKNKYHDNEKCTSFMYLRIKSKEFDENVSGSSEDNGKAKLKPKKASRFWKRGLYGEEMSESQVEDIEEDPNALASDFLPDAPIPEEKAEEAPKKKRGRKKKETVETATETLEFEQNEENVEESNDSIEQNQEEISSDDSNEQLNEDEVEDSGLNEEGNFDEDSESNDDSSEEYSDDADVDEELENTDPDSNEEESEDEGSFDESSNYDEEESEEDSDTSEEEYSTGDYDDSGEEGYSIDEDDDSGEENTDPEDNSNVDDLEDESDPDSDDDE